MRKYKIVTGISLFNEKTWKLYKKVLCFWMFIAENRNKDYIEELKNHLVTPDKIYNKWNQITEL